MDNLEKAQREKISQINSKVESDLKDEERKRLETEHGKVWNTDEVQKDFEVIGFLAPCVTVRRKSDSVKGSLFFQGRPRFYFDFKPVD